MLIVMLDSVFWINGRTRREREKEKWKGGVGEEEQEEETGCSKLETSKCRHQPRRRERKGAGPVLLSGPISRAPVRNGQISPDSFTELRVDRRFLYLHADGTATFLMVLVFLVLLLEI